MKLLANLHRFFLKAETLLLASLLISLILIAVAQVVMRNFFGGGLMWADGYTRTSVLWVSLVGAMAASRQHRHIAIDVLIQRLPKHWKGIAHRLSYFLTSLVCLFGAWVSTEFVVQEYHYGGNAFADIPNWSCQAIIPFALGVIALRYGVAAFSHSTSGRPQ